MSRFPQQKPEGIGCTTMVVVMIFHYLPLFPFTWKVILEHTVTPSTALTHSMHILRAVQGLRSLTLVWCIQHHPCPAAIAHSHIDLAAM